MLRVPNLGSGEVAEMVGVGAERADDPRLQSVVSAQLSTTLYRVLSWMSSSQIQTKLALARRHWRDRPTMPPPVDANARGAVSLGPELLQWLNWIGGNITAAHPFQI